MYNAAHNQTFHALHPYKSEIWAMSTSLPPAFAYRYVMFAGFVAINFLFVLFLLPETENVPIAEMAYIWVDHRFWKRFVLTRDERTAFEAGDMATAGLPPRPRPVGIL